MFLYTFSCKEHIKHMLYLNIRVSKLHLALKCICSALEAKGCLLKLKGGLVFKGLLCTLIQSPASGQYTPKFAKIKLLKAMLIPHVVCEVLQSGSHA